MVVGGKKLIIKLGKPLQIFSHSPIRKLREPWLGGQVGWSVVPYTKRLWVWSLVRVAHT